MEQGGDWLNGFQIDSLMDKTLFHGMRRGEICAFLEYAKPTCVKLYEGQTLTAGKTTTTFSACWWRASFTSTAWTMTLATFYENYMKSLGAYTGTTNPSTTAMLDELRYRLSSIRFVRLPTTSSVSSPRTTSPASWISFTRIPI